MSRPRLVAVLSAVASSITAFMVLSRFQLMGTLAGAVIVPTIGTLVGHWSNEGLDQAGRWMRCMVKRGASPAASPTPSQRTVPDDAATEHSSAAETSTGRVAVRRRVRSQWLLVTCAALALAVSVYSAVAPGPVQRVVVQERVVERTVTAPTGAEDSDTRALTVASSTDGGMAAGDGQAASNAAAGTDKVQTADGGTAQGDATKDETSQSGAAPSGADQAASTDSTVPTVDTTQPIGSPTGGDGSVPVAAPVPAGQDPESPSPQPGETTQNPPPAGQSD